MTTPTLVGAYEILTHDAAAARGVKHGFTTRRGAGGLLTKGDDASELARAAGFAESRVLTQVHGDRVVRAEESPPTTEADALISDRKGVMLAIKTADCVPLLFHDAKHAAVGAAHAGWRGTAANIGPKTLRAMNDAFGTKPADVTVVIGPAIGPCCFEVGPEVLLGLEQAAPGAGRSAGVTASGRDTANLWRANRMALERAGVAPERIGLVNVCTHCRADIFPSYRRDGGGTGRIYSFIGMSGPTLIHLAS